MGDVIYNPQGGTIRLGPEPELPVPPRLDDADVAAFIFGIVQTLHPAHQAAVMQAASLLAPIYREAWGDDTKGGSDG